MFCAKEDGIGNPDKADVVKYRQTKLATLGQDTGSVDGRYQDKSKLAVAAWSDGIWIGGAAFCR